MLFTSTILSRHWDSSAANQERVIGRYSKIPLAVYAHQNKAVLMTQNGSIRPQIRKITATSGSIDSIDTNLIQKALDCHLNLRKCTLTVEYVTVLRVAALIFGENKMVGKTTISAKYMASSSPDLNLTPLAAFLRFFAERSEGQIVTCLFSCGGCDTKMCCTRIIQCQQQFCPRATHRQKA